jgi:hypothetical protein
VHYDKEGADDDAAKREAKQMLAEARKLEDDIDHLLGRRRRQRLSA